MSADVTEPGSDIDPAPPSPSESLTGGTRDASGGEAEHPSMRADSVGIVEPQRVMLFDEHRPMMLEGGQVLSPIEVTYETYGSLNADRTNAVFICPALTGDAHAAGWHSTDDRKPGWWDNFIGPGKGLDTERYFIICANVLGGCQGTTGPGSTNPETGEPYGLDFPFLTIGDMVEVHAALVRHLGIEQLLAIVGGSLGGMQVLDWTTRFPTQMRAAIVLASAANLSAQGIAFNAVGRRAIAVDPNYNNGRYYDGEVPTYGLALARMIAHITYLSEASIAMKFGRRLQDAEQFAFDVLRDTEFQIESYLHYQGKQFVQRFDANSYIYLTRAMDYFDLAEKYGGLTAAMGQTEARFFIASYDTDWLFTTGQSRELVSALLTGGKHVTFTEFTSPFGHDSFLLEAEQLRTVVTPFLDRMWEEVDAGTAGDPQVDGDRKREGTR